MDIDFLKKGHIALLYDAEEGLTPIIMDETYLSKPYRNVVLRYRLNPGTMHYLRQYNIGAYFKNGAVLLNDSLSQYYRPFKYLDQFQDFIWNCFGEKTIEFSLDNLPDYRPYLEEKMTRKSQEKAVIDEALENFIEATNERLLCSRNADQGYISKLLGKIRIAKRLLKK